MFKIGDYTQVNNLKTTLKKTDKKNSVDKTNKSDNLDKMSGIGSMGTKKLSSKAMELLERLKKTYNNMDFMVADYNSEEEAKGILARGTNEFSVLFSSEELEKMAADEDYLNENLDKLEGAVKFSERINDEFGFESVFDKNTDDVEINRVGISYNQDGTMSYFAELDKVNEKQAVRIAKHKEQAKDVASNNVKDNKDTWYKDMLEGNKKVIVTADSEEELYDLIYGVDWNEVPLDNKTEGMKFDFLC